MPLPKAPKDMNLEELRMLLEVRKLEMKIELQDVQHSLRIGSRILTAVKKSGILEQITSLIASNDTLRNQTSHQANQATNKSETASDQSTKSSSQSKSQKTKNSNQSTKLKKKNL
ncbi:hypothetical protein [Leptospira sp. GIMC2001]|uniref:hypothetical protein n=1 Tax=Leptospira sp. GIMC2001 TaxID=1513297 RepID=UPI00234BC137|nr:hypothetical protein [Leptospira sp. GIMC2001]WCL47798.1 hypothetical protein O4O04_00650 [Leptospira sp. GIMC2001]